MGDGVLEINRACALSTQGCFTGNAGGFPVTITPSAPSSSRRLPSGHEPRPRWLPAPEPEYLLRYADFLHVLEHRRRRRLARRILALRRECAARQCDWIQAGSAYRANAITSNTTLNGPSFGILKDLGLNFCPHAANATVTCPDS